MACLVSVSFSLSLCLRLHLCLFINAHSWNEVKRQFSLKCCHCFCCTHCEWAIIKATVGGLKQTTIQSKRATTTTATRATSRSSSSIDNRSRHKVGNTNDNSGWLLCARSNCASPFTPSSFACTGEKLICMRCTLCRAKPAKKATNKNHQGKKKIRKIDKCQRQR